MDTVLLTGASGFIGSRLAETLKQNEHKIRLALRRKGSLEVLKKDVCFIKRLDNKTEWANALVSVDTVIHLAARVHVMNDTAIDPLSEFRKVNVEGTLNLARQAAKAGVRRFIFLSTIKVNGEETSPLKPFKETDKPAPEDGYAISKWEAEKGLFQLAKETGMEVVVIRPPLVYGPGVKANFLRMMEWLHRGIPLPFGAIDNKRSLVALDNLIDLITVCIHHPAAANQVFLVSDGEDLSTTELLRRTARALGRQARLVGVPSKFLEILLRLLGKRELARRLLGSLEVDIGKAKELLGWKPKVTVDEGLEKTAKWFLASRC